MKVHIDSRYFVSNGIFSDLNFFLFAFYLWFCLEALWFPLTASCLQPGASTSVLAGVLGVKVLQISSSSLVNPIISYYFNATIVLLWRRTQSASSGVGEYRYCIAPGTGEWKCS